MELFVFAVLLTVTGAQQSQLKGPQNTASTVGSNVTLKCLSPSNNCSGLEWLKYIAGNPVTVFSHNGIILGTYRDRYKVDKSSGCDLIIENVELTDAGRFLCRATISSKTVEKTAYLAILKCSMYASPDDTIVGGGVQLNCEATSTVTDRTLMAWKRVDDAPAAVKNRTAISRSYFVAASAPEVLSFTCITSFPFETKDDDGREIIGLATNIPNATCETSAIKVLHPVRDVQLSPSFSNYPPGSRITCMAKGHPTPTLKWQERESDGTWMDIRNQNGCEFTMTNASSKRYRCVAMNVVRGNSYKETSHEFLVNNTDNEYKENFIVTTMNPLPSTLVISVAVCEAVGLLLITLPINYFCVRGCPGYKCCHSGSKSKGKISMEEQRLRENPDIFGNANQVQDAHPTAKPRSVPTGEPPNRPQVAPPQVRPRTDNRKVVQKETEYLYMEP